MYKINHKGINHGEWEKRNLPRLAESLGVTVDELIDGSKTAEAVEGRDKAMKKAVRKRLGPQEKINAVTANVATISLMVSLSILKAVGGQEEMAAIANDLNMVFPDADGEAVPQLMEMLGGYMAGDVKTPIAAIGLERAIGQASFCGNEAFNILTEARGKLQKKPAKKGEANPDPVTG